MFNTPTPTAPQLPTETAKTKAPDGGAGGAVRRTTDRLRSGASTILTSGSGVLNAAPTGMKTLLGQ